MFPFVTRSLPMSYVCARFAPHKAPVEVAADRQSHFISFQFLEHQHEITFAGWGTNIMRPKVRTLKYVRTLRFLTSKF